MRTQYLIDLLRDHPWESNRHSLTELVINVPAMLSHTERRMLTWVIEHIYNGEGEILDLGAFLGGSALCMATGLSRNATAKRLGRIHSYDRFHGDYPVKWIKENTKLAVPDDGDYYPIYEKIIEPFKSSIIPYKGDLVGTQWKSKKPIEVLFLDVLKTPELTDSVVNAFFPFLIPGKSIVIAQDYLHNVQPFTVIAMEYYSDCFERAGDTGRGSALFVNTKPIKEHFQWSRIPYEAKLKFLTNALSKEKTFLAQQMMAHLITELVRG